VKVNDRVWVVVGAKGRMGKELLLVLENEFPNEKIVKINSISDWRTFPQMTGKKPIAVEFSSVEGLEATIKECVARKIPLICGTTGIEKRHFVLLKKAGQKIPIMWSPNMSEMIYVKGKVLQLLAKYLKNADYQIEDFHHNQKKDAPSGTGKLLKSILDLSLKRETPPVLSGRGGGIFGIHKTWAMAAGEFLTVEHTALNRGVFASGAIKAAQWLFEQKKGLYSFSQFMERKKL
jgi:4-hydroxy-tetrahydrodipicolinate reductase